MQITKIEIDNFKSFNKLSIDLQPLTLLVGANGVGKSNFLQVFEFLKKIPKGLSEALKDILSLKNINTDRRSFSIKIEIDSNEVIGRYDIENSTSNCILSCRSHIIYEIEIIVNNTDFDIIENITFEEYFAEYLLENNIPISESKRLGDTYKYGIKNSMGKFSTHQTIRSLDLFLTDGNVFKIQIENPFSERSFLQELNARYGKKSVLEYPGIFIPANLFNFGVYEINPKLAKEAFSGAESVILEKDARNLAQIISQILKDKDDAKQLVADISGMLDFIENIEIDKVGKYLYLKVKEIYNKTEVYADLLSDGTMSIIAMIVALYYQKQGILFFEEPEHGIHPSLISALVSQFYDVVEYKNKQIILTTHNPEILKNIYEKNKLKDIYLISKDEDGFSIIEKSEEKIMLGRFLQNEMGIDELYVNNLLND